MSIRVDGRRDAETLIRWPAKVCLMAAGVTPSLVKVQMPHCIVPRSRTVTPLIAARPARSLLATVATRAAILLSTYNGERFLREQLDSLLRQSCQDWTLVWRDDGSTDGTVGLMRDFLAELGAERAVVLPTTRRQGAAASYLTLLRAATAAA